MYENQTEDVILSRMLANLSDDIDKREGSVAYDMLAPKAMELAVMYIELDNLLNLGFAQTTYGQYLDLRVGEVGMTRMSAIKATGSITFTANKDLTIPKGSIVYTDTGMRFLTDAEITLSNGIGSVTITAETGGNDGNVPANSIINNEIGEVTCTNPSPTSGGVDTETDEQLLARFIKKVQTPATSGNVYHYQQWAEEVDGIGDAKVIPVWDGQNTVKVIIVGTDKKPVVDSKVKEVADYIEKVRPVGAIVTVESAVGIKMNISAKLTLQDDYNIAMVQPLIEQQLVEYFKEAAFVDSNVKYSKIGMILLNVDGILDYENLTVNGGTANIALGTNEVPVLGTVNLV